jgi:anaerobic ribonucleoside-triphosphate reductase activating protein
MLKYVDTKVVFQEIPDEITLAINISNCPCNCKNCHSSYLANDVGEPLTVIDISKLIKKNRGISCICFMGGDSSHKTINSLATWIRTSYPNLKIAWYSGRTELSKYIRLQNFDYIKLGPYIEELGPLNSTSTNQRFYKVEDNKLVDITNVFWR